MESVQERVFLPCRHNNPLLNRSGFTLVELMVVVAILPSCWQWQYPSTKQ